MPSKTCALDIMPTARLKEVLGTILPSITHIVNKSLDQGEFYTSWKKALVKPLVKKRILGTTMTNYRPVSNLQFITKIVEKVTLDQFTPLQQKVFYQTTSQHTDNITTVRLA